MHIELDKLPDGTTYESQYNGYLELFSRVAHIPLSVDIIVSKCPNTWAVLLTYMGCRVVSTKKHFVNDSVVTKWKGLTRTQVEVLCGMRPELVDALWKLDVEWVFAHRRPPRTDQRSFIVTNNGSFHRHEVIEYMSKLETYKTGKKKAVLVPCAADKPYPSPLHSKVLSILPDDYELMIATGVLGIVPMALWDEMPWYDSGIPNEWRLYTESQKFFRRNKFERVICYTDYYSLALKESLLDIVPQLFFVDEPKFRYNYLDLMQPERLSKLAKLLL